MYGSPGKRPIPSKQPEYCHRMSCFVNGSLFTEVLPLSGCLTFLKASNSPGLQTCTGLTCCPVVALVGVVVLKEVAGCTVFILPVVSLVGVVVLKEVVSCAIFCISVPVVLCVLV